jgi:hypothetical protein
MLTAMIQHPLIYGVCLIKYLRVSEDPRPDVSELPYDRLLVPKNRCLDVYVMMLNLYQGTQ